MLMGLSCGFFCLCLLVFGTGQDTSSRYVSVMRWVWASCVVLVGDCYSDRRQF